MNKNPLSYAAKAAYVAGALLASSVPAKADVEPRYGSLSMLMKGVEATSSQTPTQLSLTDGTNKYVVTLIQSPSEKRENDNQMLGLNINNDSIMCRFNGPVIGDYAQIPKETSSDLDCMTGMFNVLDLIDNGKFTYANKTGLLVDDAVLARIANSAAYHGKPGFTTDEKNKELNKKIVDGLTAIIEHKEPR